MTLFKLAGVNLKGDAQIPEFNPRTMETNVPGVYAAGTAVAGTQDRYKIFLENCHVHVDRIVAALTARALPPEAEPSHAIPES
jgi:thioredoxin reductase (NADPH)